MKKLTRYGNKRFDSLISNLKAYAHAPDEERLHKIRVETKKIKAVQQVVGHYSKKYDAHRNFIPLREIFRKAGDIRSPLLMNQLLQEHRVQGLENIGLEKVTARIEKFQRKIPEFVQRTKKCQEKVGKYIRNVSKKKLTGYVSSKLKEVKTQLYPKPTFERLHKVRKTIKEVVYLSVVLKSADKVLIQKFKSLEELVGQFHDKQVLIQLLESNQWVDKAKIDILKSESEINYREIAELVRRIYSPDLKIESTRLKAKPPSSPKRLLRAKPAAVPVH